MLKNATLLVFTIILVYYCNQSFGQLSQKNGNTIQILKSNNTFTPNLYKNRIVPIFMIAMGIGMTGIWTADIVSGKFSDRGNFFQWREGENILWPHIAAEYLTSFGLIVGGMGLYNGKEWSVSLSLVSLGAVAYSAINSSGWVIAEKERLPYGIPMWISLTGAAVSFTILIK